MFNVCVLLTDFHIINMLCVTRAQNHEKIIKDTKINITIYAFVKKNTRIEDDMNKTMEVGTKKNTKNK